MLSALLAVPVLGAVLKIFTTALEALSPAIKAVIEGIIYVLKKIGEGLIYIFSDVKAILALAAVAGAFGWYTMRLDNPKVIQKETIKCEEQIKVLEKVVVKYVPKKERPVKVKGKYKAQDTEPTFIFPHSNAGN